MVEIIDPDLFNKRVELTYMDAGTFIGILRHTDKQDTIIMESVECISTCYECQSPIIFDSITKVSFKMKYVVELEQVIR